MGLQSSGDVMSILIQKLCVCVSLSFHLLFMSPPVSHQYLTSISSIHQYLTSTSPVSHKYLTSISPVSHHYLASLGLLWIGLGLVWAGLQRISVVNFSKDYVYAIFMKFYIRGEKIRELDCCDFWSPKVMVLHRRYAHFRK